MEAWYQEIPLEKAASVATGCAACIPWAFPFFERILSFGCIFIWCPGIILCHDIADNMREYSKLCETHNALQLGETSLSLPLFSLSLLSLHPPCLSFPLISPFPHFLSLLSSALPSLLFSTPATFRVLSRFYASRAALQKRKKNGISCSVQKQNSVFPRGREGSLSSKKNRQGRWMHVCMCLGCFSEDKEVITTFKLWSKGGTDELKVWLGLVTFLP